MLRVIFLSCHESRPEMCVNTRAQFFLAYLNRKRVKFLFFFWKSANVGITIVVKWLQNDFESIYWTNSKVEKNFLIEKKIVFETFELLHIFKPKTIVSIKFSPLSPLLKVFFNFTFCVFPRFSDDGNVFEKNSPNMNVRHQF